MRKFYIALIFMCLTGAAIWLYCRDTGADFDSTGVADLPERDAEVIEAVLRSESSHPTDRIYFLTNTPMGEWFEHKRWNRLPNEFHRKISDLTPAYLPADGAYINRRGSVFQRGTNREAWMQWIFIRRWISDTEVEISNGVWRCSLGGGGHSAVYRKIDGHWQFDRSLGNWVS